MRFFELEPDMKGMILRISVTGEGGIELIIENMDNQTEKAMSGAGIQGATGEAGRSEFAVAGQDISDHKQSEERFAYKLTHDIATGLFNRLTFNEALDTLRGRHSAYCLVVLNINGMRLINYIFGHAQGDQAILDVAGALREIFPQNELIFRMGGDEFAVIMKDANIEHAAKECEKINEFCRNTYKRLMPISLSWGAACHDEEERNAELYRLAETRMLGNKMQQPNSASGQLVAALREALRARDAETAEHMARMEYMVGRMGERLNLIPHDFDRLMLLASMHDVGKLGIPDQILNKPGSLTPEEWAVMQRHPEIGYRITLSSPLLTAIAAEILGHHERWDGSGYPHGKRADEIPLLAQVIAVVDAYDVITHARPYKTAASHQHAVGELQRCAGSHFSPRVVDHFLNIFGKLCEQDIRHFSE